MNAALLVLALGACRPDATPRATPNDAVPNVPNESVPVPVVEPAAVCGVARGELARQLALIDASCTVDADCALQSVQYDSCELPMAFRKGVEKNVEPLRDLLRDTRALCGYLARPCAAPQGFAACDAGRCVARAGVPSEQAQVWRGALATTAGPLASTPVHIELFQQVQCVRAPCPPMSAGTLDLTTDTAGVVHVDVGANMRPADHAVLTVEGYEPARVTLRATDAPLLLELRKRP